MMKTGFSVDRMHTYLRGYYAAMGWKDAQAALAFAREKHAGQYRKGGEPYLVHPLTMACHAAALGIRSEAVAVACLLHDVCEDCGVDPMDLPVSNQETKDAVRLLTHAKGVPLADYYTGISKNAVASITKILDRCDNVSTMGGVFSNAKTLSYVEETETYVMPLWRTAKDRWPEYADALFVLKYHILSVTSGLASVIPPVREGLQSEYTVCFLFSSDLSHVLLQKKAKTDFAGKLNGVGGKIEPKETPMTCARREIQEETGLADVEDLRWIGTLHLPWNCDSHREDDGPFDPACVLYYYAGIIPEGRTPTPPPGGEELSMNPVRNVVAAGVLQDKYAGNGDLAYFVNQGVQALRVARDAKRTENGQGGKHDA